MKNNDTKSKKWGWIAAIVTMLVVSWLAANWEDFKAGVTGGYAEQTNPHP